ncbi:MAG: prepilin-type N-terminal cleavage/methylation domain-containing protein, partial [Candidatus Omnitrophica bacterium]|nr:prepilin-type N-terminal cleavage/methylation domain-containing protein [Candidatus Omnitrophota bacterium]
MREIICSLTGRSSGRGSLKGLTLMELMVVVIIIGVLAGVSVVSYRDAREKSLDKEAVAGLKLVRSAQRQYFIKFKRYWPAGTVSNVAQINGNLSLDLGSGSWTFSV